MYSDFFLPWDDRKNDENLVPVLVLEKHSYMERMLEMHSRTSTRPTTKTKDVSDHRLGDIVVKTSFGRIVAVLLGLIGVVFTGLMVAAAIRAVEESMREMKKS